MLQNVRHAFMLQINVIYVKKTLKNLTPPLANAEPDSIRKMRCAINALKLALLVKLLINAILVIKILIEKEILVNA